jgi:hypothetical protein
LPSREVIQGVKKPRMQSFLLDYAERVGGFNQEDKLADFFAPHSPDPLAVDMLKQILRFDPDERPDIEELLQHPYFANLHCEEDEPCGISIPAEEFAFEEGGCNADTLRAELVEEILIYSDLGEGSVVVAEEKETFDGGVVPGAKANVEKPAWIAEIPDDDIQVIVDTIEQAARKYGGADVIEEEEKEEMAAEFHLSIDQIDEVTRWIYNRA